MKLSDLKISKRNPQVFGDLSKLKKSIEEMPKMMVLRPMVYDPSTMEVLGGNKRLICLQEMGFKEIPDTWTLSAANLTKEEKKRFILADNVMFGTWDFEMLETEFSDIDIEELGIEVDFDNTDYSDKNKEIDTDEFSDKMILKFEFSEKEYKFITNKLNHIDANKENALLNILNYES